MGKEAKRTTLEIDGEAHDGDALLETDELFVRVDGEPKRRKLALRDLAKLRARGTRLSFEHDGHRYAIEVGDAASWVAKIASPPSLLDKLGIARGASVHVAGIDDAAFTRDLAAARTKRVPLGPAASVVVLGATTKAHLAAVAKARRAVGDTIALWIAYPKGKKEFGEAHVRSAGIAAGLVDVKVARFSSTHSALKLVVRKSERKATKKT
ncbi:MAG TPA: hypothetical protein VL400_04975 [Polyangiaceae bacterium]|jgi:hypothetical protein|nr:hypothetical protein [Polyangiaceae bacterium]